MPYNLRRSDSTADVDSIYYSIDSVEVCSSKWGHYHGVQPATMRAFEAALRAGSPAWTDACAKEHNKAMRLLRGELINAATSWWHIRLTYYEKITKEGIILHPRDIFWAGVYKEEFVPMMRLMGHNWREASAQR